MVYDPIQEDIMAAKKKDTADFVMVDGIKCTTAAPLVDLDKMIPYEKNARVHGSELEFLKNCYKDPEIGFCDPIEVDADMIIVSGHGRRQAALEVGMTKAPCIIHKHLHGDASDAYRLEANRQSDLSGYDFDVLNFEIDRLNKKDWDMARFGFEDMTRFDEPEAMTFEDAHDEVDFVTEADREEDPTFKIMVNLPSKSAQDELFEYLLRNGYDCQVL